MKIPHLQTYKLTSWFLRYELYLFKTNKLKLYTIVNISESQRLVHMVSEKQDKVWFFFEQI